MARDRNRPARGADRGGFPTVDPCATVRFYRDLLGFPIVNSVCEAGRGTPDHPDVVRFSFGTHGNGRLTFCYGFGVEGRGDNGLPLDSRPVVVHVGCGDALDEYRRHLEDDGWAVEPRSERETPRSFRTRDPNGVVVEFTDGASARAAVSDEDAALTVSALLDVLAGDRPTLSKVWARKAELIVAGVATELEGQRRS